MSTTTTTKKLDKLGDEKIMEITKETQEYMATKKYQKQLAQSYDEEARGYDDSCPNEENEVEVV